MSCNGCQFGTSEKVNEFGRVEMLTVNDWLSDLPDTSTVSDIVEVRFKGTRKEYFKNSYELKIKRGDRVVCGMAPGHDLGIVTLIGKLAEKQFDRKINRKQTYKWNPIYRIANQHDLARWQEAQAREKDVMIRARQIAAELNLDMKVGDVEIYGDNAKAIFYYIADNRVDFRQLIKMFASEFRVKVEMKQIGARQEAARVGGIGSCGRELCCSSWRTDFSSITSHMATVQGISPNAEKLTGRCGKLKCCLMYELDVYLEAYNEFPTELLNLELENGWAFYIKSDLLQRIVFYSQGQGSDKQQFALPLDMVKEVIQNNKKGIRPALNDLIDGDALGLKAENVNMFKVEDNTKLPPLKKRRKPNNRKKSEGEDRTAPKRLQANSTISAIRKPNTTDQTGVPRKVIELKNK
jgi:cell fate regulator YaaT (PSP1 superfamily)